ncbi:arginyl-tRNA--protein transferase 1-like isoform X3 [Dendronephthya gigantea]|uniref:arginyl-tRNA--protein transferase 1-like isoform X3 n=1 Tax=Dendronephthya gigantea TaxID=151771 RepID=UPI00106A6228|nr:arginyl-tRNA--protein transferase 1-like isoform X3 [Dendronephthya gigantea]
MDKNVSIVEYFFHEDKDGSRCGYCKGSDTNFSLGGMWGHQVTCQDYQDLIDRGWRRSGKYLYKSDMKKTCCPLYTIRCNAMEFKPSKSHKKLLKKVEKYLNDNPTETAGEANAPDKNEEGKALPESLQVEEKVKGKDLRQRTESKSVGADPSKPKCQKAKAMRIERKRQKLAAKGIEMPEQPKQHEAPDAKTLEERIAAHSPSDQSTHRLERVLVKCDPNLPEFKKTYQQSFELFCKYQKEIHKDKPEKLNEPRFRRFLVDSPLLFEKHSSTPTTGWGSFHEQFFLDGKLIAVGVLDILPSCVSSVYLYYDTDYSFLSPGIYSALRELHLARELNKTCSNLKYYYMGFYVHSCPKMKYKAQYTPSYLVCPETYSWIPVERCTPKLDIEKYSRLDETDKEDAVVDINTVRVLALREGRGEVMTYKMYTESRFSSKNDEKEVKEYAQLIGPLVAPRMALYRS